ncbi:MAG: phosphotransferase enzyme family protein [Myxococcota bacterium]
MDLSHILGRFPEVPKEAMRRVRSTSDGLINATWLVGDRFVLQRVNPLFGAEVNEDIQALTVCLRRADVPVPRLLLTSDDRPCVIEDGVWRVMTRLPGNTVHRVSEPRQAGSAARLIARFHGALEDSTHTFKFTRPGAHDTEAHMRTLADAVDAHPGHRLAEPVRPLAQEILERWRGLPKPETLPPRIVHGDLKISNVLFDASNHAVGLIDLDTMAWSDLEVELGDALRSWCSTTTEDAPNPELDVAIFEAAVTGYFEASPSTSPSERRAVVRGLERITLELAARFGADALNERYFGWSEDVAPTRGEHNLIRARNQLRLARCITEVRPELSAIAQTGGS